MIMKVKLFGFEFSIDVDECSKNSEGKLADNFDGGSEQEAKITRNEINNQCSKKFEGKVGGNSEAGGEAEAKITRNERDTKKYECQFCFKEFANSQALGGHQNAHKKERQMKKRLQLQARKASFSCRFLHPLQSYGFKRHAVVNPWSYDPSFYTTELVDTTASRSLNSRIIDEFPEFRSTSNESLHLSGFFLPSSPSLSSETSKREVLDFSSARTKSFNESSEIQSLLLVQPHANQ